MKNSGKDGKPSASFVAGCVALLFLIIGYQSALFIRKAAVARIVADHDHPDTVFVFVDSTGIDWPSDASSGGSTASLRLAPPLASQSEAPVPPLNLPRVAVVSPSRLASDGRQAEGTYGKAARDVWRAHAPRRYESFPFDPNTVSIDDLMRLGFTLKQAQSIDNYRKKGGRFRRKGDFAKSYVVEDSVYKRLEKYITIPRIDINKADSTAFETLHGIGPFFASRMVSYRDELGGYSYPEQLMDIWHFDREKFDGLKDLITVGPSEPYSLWTLPEPDLARHPYIGRKAAHAIIIFRTNTPPSDWSVDNLVRKGILDVDKGSKLARCRIADP